MTAWIMLKQIQNKNKTVPASWNFEKKGLRTSLFNLFGLKDKFLIVLDLLYKYSSWLIYCKHLRTLTVSSQLALF